MACDALKPIRTKNSLPQRKWQHVMVTYDGSGKAAGISIYVGGQPQQVEVVHDQLTGSIKTDKPLQLGRRGGEAGFRGMLDFQTTGLRNDLRGQADALLGLIFVVDPGTCITSITSQGGTLQFEGQKYCAAGM